ncbi:hypothetical protein BT96DRAFT_922593, partial [Gymnopus androsaceus JB14]
IPPFPLPPPCPTSRAQLSPLLAINLNSWTCHAGIWDFGRYLGDLGSGHPLLNDTTLAFCLS